MVHIARVLNNIFLSDYTTSGRIAMAGLIIFKIFSLSSDPIFLEKNYDKFFW